MDEEGRGLAGELFTAGTRVPPGRFQRVGRDRVVVLPAGGHLPPSFDGEVAVYRRLPDPVLVV